MPAADPAVSIVTPTWNRVHTLPRLYNSLVGQRSKNGRFTDLEWIVVDDGSEDDTASLVQRLVDASQIDIRYLRQPNGGLHVAVNRGVEPARGRFTSIVDSDDWLTPDALRRCSPLGTRFRRPSGRRSSGWWDSAQTPTGASSAMRFRRALWTAIRSR